MIGLIIILGWLIRKGLLMRGKIKKVKLEEKEKKEKKEEIEVVLLDEILERMKIGNWLLLGIVLLERDLRVLDIVIIENRM